MSSHVVIGGQRGSGKSTLSASLYEMLVSMRMSVGIHEVDVYSDTIPCILGWKPWSERQKRKWAWFDPTIKKRIWEFSSDPSEIVLGDLPGKITNQFLPRMVEPAKHAVIVARDLANLVQWENFFEKQKIPVELRIISHRGDPPDRVNHSAPIYFINGLDRAVVSTPQVRAIAERIIDFC